MDPFDAATGYFGAWLQGKVDEGFTRKDVAMKVGVQASTVGRLMSGSRSNPYLDTLLRAAYAFQVEPAEMMPKLAELNEMVRRAEDAAEPEQG